MKTEHRYRIELNEGLWKLYDATTNKVLKKHVVRSVVEKKAYRIARNKNSVVEIFGPLGDRLGIISFGDK